MKDYSVRWSPFRIPISATLFTHAWQGRAPTFKAFSRLWWKESGRLQQALNTVGQGDTGNWKHWRVTGGGGGGYLCCIQMISETQKYKLFPTNKHQKNPGKTKTTVQTTELTPTYENSFL